MIDKIEITGKLEETDPGFVKILVLITKKINEVIDTVNKQRHDFALLVDTLHSDKPVQQPDTKWRKGMEPCPSCAQRDCTCECPTCVAARQEPDTCIECGGSGNISWRSGLSSGIHTCPTCNGTGKKPDYTPCSSCDKPDDPNLVTIKKCCWVCERLYFGRDITEPVCRVSLHGSKPLPYPLKDAGPCKDFQLKKELS